MQVKKALREAGSVNDVDSSIQLVYADAMGQLSCQPCRTILPIPETAESFQSACGSPFAT